MKYRTALKQSIASIRFLLIGAPAAWIGFWFMPHWLLATSAALMTFYLAMEIWNVISIKRVAAKDPTALDRTVPGTE